MRKIQVFENVSLDGLFSGPNGEYDWTTPDEDMEISRYVRDSGAQNDVNTFLLGRKTYDIMASFWPT